MFPYFDESYKDAVIIKLISEWKAATASKPLGRTVIQKLCYFAKTVDIPLGYKFSVYQFGPYSQDLYDHIDDMVSMGLITDEYLQNEQKTGMSSYSVNEEANKLLVSHKDALGKTEKEIRFLMEFFKDKSVRDLELLSTTHYYYTANKDFFKEHDKDHIKDLTIKKVLDAKKDKFERCEILEAYNLLVETPQFN